MELILLIFSVWAIGKGMKCIFRKAPATSRKGKTATAVTKTTSFAALTALQQQRDIIREQISDINEMLDFCPPQKIRNQLMNRKTTLLGRLATTETKISKLCA